MECWAKQLGDCAGPQSGEHYFSNSLFDAPTIDIKGFTWCKSEYVTLPLTTARANILCKHHNESLSDTDSEALRFQRVVKTVSRKPRLTKDGRLKQASQRHLVSGPLLARWFTKTYCNVMTVAKRRVDDDFVSYSFGRPTRRELHIYMHVFKGLALKPTLGHVTVQDFFDECGNTLWYVKLAGFPWLVSTVDLRDLRPAFAVGDDAISVDQFMNKPRRFVVANRPGRILSIGGVIQFDW